MYSISVTALPALVLHDSNTKKELVWVQVHTDQSQMISKDPCISGVHGCTGRHRCVQR